MADQGITGREFNMEHRRVVAANNQHGRAIVVSDERLPSLTRGVGHGMVGSELWSTDSMPVSNAPDADAAQRKGFIKVHNNYNYIGSGQGTAFRITEWEPGHTRFTHRTQTVDYDVVLSGEIDLELDDGQVVHLKAGDSVVLRGCTHTWINRGEVPAFTAFVLIDADAVVVSGEELPPLFPSTS